MEHPLSSPKLSDSTTRAAVLGLLMSAGSALDVPACPLQQDYKKGTIVSQAAPDRPIDEVYAKPLRDLMHDMIMTGTPLSTREISEGVWEVRYVLHSPDKRYVIMFMLTDGAKVLPDRDSVQIEEFDGDGNLMTVIGDTGLTGSPSYGRQVIKGEEQILYHLSSGQGLEYRPLMQEREARLVSTARTLFETR